MIHETLEKLQVPIEGLKPYHRNPRQGDVGAIMQSLEHHGQYRPIVVNARTQEVLAGNHTLAAARELGWTQIAATFVDVDDDQAARIVLVDNRANDLATYDAETLTDLLKELATETEHRLEGTGFDGDDLDEMLAGFMHDTSGGAPDPGNPPADPVTKMGDVIVMGDHRLVCGNALDPDALHVLMDEGSFDLMVTSPPYNQRLDSFKPTGMQTENPAWVNRMAGAYNDSMPEQAYQDQQVEMLNGIAPFASRTASAFYNHKVRYRDKRAVIPTEWLTKSEWAIRQEIVWDRHGSITLNARMFMPQDERIYWLTIGDDFLFNDTTDIKSWGTIWPITAHAEIQISAPFPIEIPERAIAACSLSGGIVLDPYAGSGTTLIACENLGRQCRAVEIDPGYCDVIVDRWERHTGRTAEREAKP